jgi:hypothetical protein
MMFQNQAQMSAQLVRNSEHQLFQADSMKKLKAELGNHSMDTEFSVEGKIKLEF